MPGVEGGMTEEEAMAKAAEEMRPLVRSRSPIG
jgi:hypothetical protein